MSAFFEGFLYGLLWLSGSIAVIGLIGGTIYEVWILRRDRQAGETRQEEKPSISGKERK